MNERDGRYRQFVEASSDCMKELDRDGTIRFMAGLGCVGVAPDGPERLIGTRWLDLWPLEARDMVARVLDRAASGERVDFVGARRIGTAATRWWEVTVTPVIVDDMLDHFVVISRDVTERVELQASLEAIIELLQDRLNETVASTVNAAALTPRRNGRLPIRSATTKSRP